jgi:alkylation response protein AidB-like acyl-CoA dehydrogenase
MMETVMSFDVSENQKMIAQMVRDFGAREIKPFSMEWDETQHFPVDLFKKMGGLGLMGVLVPEEYGGSGFGYHEYVTAIVEVSKIDGSIGLSVAAHNSLCTGIFCSMPAKNKSKSIFLNLLLANGLVPGG